MLMDMAVRLHGTNLPLFASAHSPSCHDLLLTGFWTRLLQDGRVRRQALGGGVVVHTQASMDPCFAEDILGAELYAEHGTFRTLVAEDEMPRVAALLTLDGVAVAHALLHPIHTHRALADTHHQHAVVGFAGIYVRPDLRGQGFARQCAAAIGAHMADWVQDGMACVAESHVVPLFSAALPCPVVSRYDQDRIDSPTAVGLRDAAPRLTPVQKRTWARMVQAGALQHHMGGIVSQVAAAPICVEEIDAAGLGAPCGEMAQRLRALQTPRALAIARDGDTMVAYALLMPARSFGCGSADTPRWMGTKIGLLGGRHAPGSEEALHACFQAIAERVQQGEGRTPVCLVAEVEHVEAARVLFSVPVVSRFHRDRFPGERRLSGGSKPTVARQQHRMRCAAEGRVAYLYPVPAPLADLDD